MDNGKVLQQPKEEPLLPQYSPLEEEKDLTSYGSSKAHHLEQHRHQQRLYQVAKEVWEEFEQHTLMKRAHYRAGMAEKLANLDAYHHGNLGSSASIAGGGVVCIGCGCPCVDKGKAKETPKDAPLRDRLPDYYKHTVRSYKLRVVATQTPPHLVPLRITFEPFEFSMHL